MIEKIVLIIAILLFLMIIIVVNRAIISKQTILGKPPVPVFYFILAKMFVLINLIFLFLKGLNTNISGIYNPDSIINLVALILLIAGAVLVFISTYRLNRDLIFGLPPSGNNELQTTGIYSISRHPFYLGFIIILFSSCLLTPHLLNILSFIGAWLIHHFIMIKEEEFLSTQFGDKYLEYTKKVKRYIVL